MHSLLTTNATFGIWATNWLEEAGFDVELPVVCYSDSKAGIAIAKNANMNFRYSRHIDVRQMFIRDLIKDKKFDVLWLKGEKNIPSDGMTKPFGKSKFLQLRDVLSGHTDISSYTDMDVDYTLEYFYDEENDK